MFVLIHLPTHMSHPKELSSLDRAIRLWKCIYFKFVVNHHCYHHHHFHFFVIAFQILRDSRYYSRLSRIRSFIGRDGTYANVVHMPSTKELTSAIVQTKSLVRCSSTIYHSSRSIHILNDGSKVRRINELYNILMWAFKILDYSKISCLLVLTTPLQLDSFFHYKVNVPISTYLRQMASQTKQTKF